MSLVLAVLCAVLTGCSSGTGSPSSPSSPSPLLRAAPRLVTPRAAAPASVSPAHGWDVSHPQCARSMPTGGGFAIVGITGGKPFSSNRCLGSQLRWARGHQGYAVYVNTSNGSHSDPVGAGRAIARDAIRREHAAGSHGVSMWWLDVETVNAWTGTAQENATVLDSLAVTLQRSGARVGFYSTPLMWAQVAGDWQPRLPIWLATGPGTAAGARARCADGFAGSLPSLVQWEQHTAHRRRDHDLVCPSATHRAGDFLVLR
ncbi:MAG: hypothetical protein ACXV2H_12555 [Actinomycetes bacterium]